MDPELPPHLAGLLEPAAYPHPVSEIRLIQTHISWVLLTGTFAYKLKRPVFLPFADFRLLQRREFLCREELRLNRRFAPQIYLDVCEVRSLSGRAHIGGQGEIIEHAVRMRQFEPDEELDRLLASQAIAPDLLQEFGASLAVLHRSFPVAAASDPWGEPAQIRRIVLGNHEELCSALAAREIPASMDLAALRAFLEEALESRSPLMSARKAGGFVRECHGDLHMGNIMRSGAALVPFDCLEFEPSFRWIDVADEVSFLCMDLGAAGHAAHAHAFLLGYLEASGDYQACRLLKLYSTHRALVRAKVEALRPAAVAAQPDKYLRQAAESSRDRLPGMVLMHGLSGSGKTWLARQLAARLGAVHVRSDVERKRLAGIPEFGHSGSRPGEGLYSREANARLYAYLADCADHALAGGFDVVVDAAFLRRADRARFQALAREGGWPVSMIHCRAPAAVLHTRIEARGKAGGDASEADHAVLDFQRARIEDLAPEESLRVIDADTSRADVLAQVLTGFGDNES